MNPAELLAAEPNPCAGREKKERLLALESSCDETAAAVLEWREGRPHILSNVVASQAELHAHYGGVVPELASREHLAALEPVTRAALQQAGLGWSELDAVAATRGPGLASALLIGHCFARTLALSRGLAFIGVNHLEGHLVSPFLADGAPSLEECGSWLSMIVSGGHTSLFLATAQGERKLLASTRDDAAGEAFDKGAKLLGLGYPGGPVLEKCARGGDARRFVFPRAFAGTSELSFSFSGLKTSLRYLLEREFAGAPPQGQDLSDLCASFQAAIVGALCDRTQHALRLHPAKTLTLAGGVACNGALREAMLRLCETSGLRLLAAPPQYCTDNAAMIGAAGLLALREGRVSEWTEDIHPNLSLLSV